MEKIAVEFRGTLHNVTREQLGVMVQRGFVAPDSTLFVDGRTTLVRDFLGTAQRSTTAPVPPVQAPDSSATAPVPPFPNSSGAAPQTVTVPGATRNVNTGGAVDGMFDMNEFLGENGRKEEKKPNSKGKYVVMGVVALLLLVGGALAGFYLIPSMVKKTDKSAVGNVDVTQNPAEVKNDVKTEEKEQEFSQSVASVDSVESSDVSSSDDATEELGVANNEISNDVAETESKDEEKPIDRDAELAIEKTLTDLASERATNEDEDDKSGREELAEENDSQSYEEAEYENVPFDDSITEIKPRFKGCDLPDVYRGMLSAFKVTKDEYETTREFEKRKAGLMKNVFSKSVSGSIMPNSRVAALVTMFKQEYNADARKLECYLSGMIGLGNSISIVKNLETSTYTAQNAYGVEKEVEKVEITEYGVSTKSEVKRDYAIPLSPEEARNLKWRIEALVVFTIDPQKDARSGEYSGADINYIHIEPKITSPKESVYWAHTIYVKDVEIWFYDRETGEILLKSSASRKAKPSYSKYEVSRTPSDSEDGVREVKEVEPVKTWQELLSESVDEQANWEKKKPAIVVPDDAPTLTDALEKAKSGDVVQLKKSTTPYPLGVKLSSGRTGLMLDKPVAIVGETGDPSDVVIEIGVMESVFVETKGAMFKGVTLSCGPLGLEKTCSPLVTVGASGYATFKYCEFHGNGVERSVGVKLSGQNSRAAFWKSVFRRFGDSGVLSEEESAAKLQYCEFLDGNHYGFTSESGASVTIERCHFADNQTCIHALSGGGGKIVESRFEGNERRAEISAASRNKFEESDNVYDKK